MTPSWLAYLPPHLAFDLLAHPNVSPLERVMRQQVVALFADISGFTPMSEALGNIGPLGTEELSQILNRTFGAMIQIIDAFGGSIGKFAGDAITVVFPYQERTKRTTVRRAIQCALDMQVAITQAAEHPTSAGVFRLSMKIGLGIGNLLTTTVGDPTIRLEYLLVGSAIDACTEAEQHAHKGAVVVCDDMLPWMNAHDPQRVALGLSTLTRLRRRPLSAPTSILSPLDTVTIATITRYLPRAIAERIETGQQAFVDEHRSVTTVFVRFAGFDYQDEGVLEQLQTYLRQVIQISAQYGGYLRQVDVGDKGSLFIVLFGAPIAHEDDAERALLCALNLRSAAHGSSVTTAMGITTGRIFCGFVGSATRCEYAAIGDAVNLAARLMSVAQPYQILVDADTRQRSTASFQWYDLPPLVVKGKTAPIVVAALEGRQPRSVVRLRAPSYTLPMVGRERELRMAKRLLTQVIAGHSQLLLITAEAGMGKSRLVAELLRHVSRKPIVYYTSECLSYGQQPYLVWQRLLRALFGLTTLSEAEQIAQVHTILHSFDPQLLERAPLLSPLLNLPFRDTDLTRGLEGRVRQEALQTLLLTCLQHWTRTHPLLLILEDCHWIDELSAELLLTIAQRGSGLALLLLITYRPLEQPLMGPHATLGQLRRLSHAHELHLREFTRAETEQLIALKLAQRFGTQGPVLPLLLERISEQSQGNPFYIDELLNLMHEREIDVRDGAMLAGVVLPESLQRLIVSRIDQLEEGAKSTLKVASIIGRLFPADWVWQVYPSLGDATQVRQQLVALQQHDFTQLERREPEVEYLFKHIITREVAYESLALSTRLVLHEQVGAFIEARYTDGLERYLDLLAYHYGHSANTAKQREYYWRAGQAAFAAYAHAAATHYFEQLLTVLAEEERGPTLVALAEVLDLVGSWSKAEQHSRHALELAERIGDMGLTAQAARVHGQILNNLGQYAAAWSALEQARAIYTALQDQHGLAATLQAISGVAHSQGHYEVALAESTACLELATAIDAYAVSCHVLYSIGAIYGEQEHFHKAITYFEHGRQLATEHNLRVELAQMLSGIGAMYSELGAYQEAFTCKQHALALSLAIGYYTHTVISLANLGWDYQEVGQYRQAQQCYLATLTLIGEFPDPRLLGYLLMRLAQVIVETGNIALAEPLLLRSIAIGHACRVPRYLIIGLGEHAEHCLQQGRYADAAHSTEEALALALQLHIRTHEFKSRVRGVQLAVRQGQLPLDTAIAQLDVLRMEWTDPEQQALLDDVVWQLAPQQERARQAAAVQYRALYERIPKAMYRQRYAKLTSEWLPLSPPLPDPPAIVDEHTIDIETLLQRVDRFLAAMGDPAHSTET